MKHLKYFEHIKDLNLLNVNDFIVINFNRNAPDKIELNNFFNNNVGQLFGNSSNIIHIIYNISNIKKEIVKYFIGINDHECKIVLSKDYVDLLFSSPNKKEAEEFIQIYKYNL